MTTPSSGGGGASLRNAISSDSTAFGGLMDPDPEEGGTERGGLAAGGTPRNAFKRSSWSCDSGGEERRCEAAASSGEVRGRSERDVRGGGCDVRAGVGLPGGTDDGRPEEAASGTMTSPTRGVGKG